MPESVQSAVREMAAAMSADERVLTFMQGAKFALEAVKAEQAKQGEAQQDG